ncbi:MAG TPA: cbb3-type cytochrome oxidase assembly protein CcoS [Verrucomicrobiota bacterium]|nr:cbb3-type cytochrome oxidase assembly protein CcoS [Verrucomicrobiota bacterium]
MSVIVILILASIALALLFLCGFIWAVKSGQFEDTCTPSMRVLGEEKANNSAASESTLLRSESASTTNNGGQRGNNNRPT